MEMSLASVEVFIRILTKLEVRIFYEVAAILPNASGPNGSDRGEALSQKHPSSGHHDKLDQEMSKILDDA